MKKITKITTAISSIALLAGCVAPLSTNFVVFADAEPLDAGVSFALDKSIPETFVIGKDSEIEVPSNPTNGEIKVYDPANQLVTLNAGKFTPAYSGDYRFVINFSGVSLFEKIMKVSMLDLSFDFESNTNRILPSEMSATNPITLKLPNVKVIDNETDLEVSGSVGTISRELIKPGAASTEAIPGNETDGFAFTPDVAGEYRVVFKYTVGSNVILKKEYAINVTNTFENTYTLKYEFKTSKPTTAKIGVETKLPDVKGTNATTNEEVPVYYTIKAEKDGTDVSATVLNGNTFLATAEGDYVITYTIKDVFGNTASVNAFTIADVVDDVKPEVAFGIEENGKIVDQKYLVPTKTTTKNIILPAIVAKDNASSASGISYKRSIKLGGTETILSSGDNTKKLVINYSADDWSATNGDIADYVKYDDKSFGSGAYTVIYKAEDEKGNIATLSLPMTIVDALTSSEPVITFSTVLPSSANVGDVVTFVAPTATDTNDTRLKLEVFYKIDENAEVLMTESSTGIYTVPTTTAGDVKIIVKATNDSGITITLDRTIKIKNIIDTEGPSALGVTPIATEYNQFDEITLPNIEFQDNNIDYLSVKVIVKNAQGEPVATYGKKSTFVDANKVRISDVKFNATKSGVYTVAYVATDIGGNVCVAAYKTASVVRTATPTITNQIFTQTYQTLELGEKLTLPVPSVTAAAGKKITSPVYSIVVVSATGDYDIVGNNKFVPYAVGQYVIQYKVSDSTDPTLTTTSAKYTISVVDTTKPTITTNYNDVDLTIAKGTEFSIKRLFAEDSGLIDYTKSKVQIKKDTLTYLELTSESDNDSYSYTFNADGEYTILYTAYDKQGLTSTKSFTVRVGDTEKPTLSAKEALKFENIGVGDDLTFDIANLEMSDNKSTNDKLLESVKVVVKNTTKDTTITNALEGTGYKYSITEVGEYEVKFTVKDEAGNERELIKTFSVSADEANTNFPTQVVGIVLIVLSVLVLGAVVIYFITTRKKTAVKKSAKSRK